MNKAFHFSQKHRPSDGVARRSRSWGRGLVFAALAMVSVEAFGHGAYLERVAQIMVSLEQHPEDAGLRVQLADVRCEHGDWQAALEELDRADQIAPGKFPTDFYRGQAYLAGAQPDKAKAALDRAVAANADHPQALLWRARALVALAQPAASLADYRAAWRMTVRLEPDFVQEFAGALSANGQRDEALQVISAGIEKLGAIPSLVLLALDLDIAAGRFESALTRVDALQKTAPRVEPWMAKRAGLLAQAGRRDEARAAWQALIEHLATLPNLERGSHAMSRLAEQAHQELRALGNVSAPSSAQPLAHLSSSLSPSSARHP